MQSVGKTREELLEELKPAARERVVRSLVITEIKDREGIEITPEEIEAELDRLAASGGEKSKNLRQIFESDAGRRSLEGSLLTRKTLKRLEEIVTQRHGEDEPTPVPDSEEEQPAHDDQPQ